MTENESSATAGKSGSEQRLAVLLAAAMFVLVVDTSMMNVSISAVVTDLGTTVSGVQSAIALEALVSASFILIGSKFADLFGRKRAYVLGLLGYAAGAVAMTVAQSLTAVIIFWAIIGGLGASLLLPSMQSLIHGNFEGAARKRAYALVGAATGIAAAVGPLLGGFITTYLSWRVGFALEAVIIAIVLLNIRLVKDVAYTGERSFDPVGALLSILGMGGIVLSVLVWQEGGEAVGVLLAVGLAAMALLVFWLRRRARAGKPALLDPSLFRAATFRLGVSGQMLQNIALGGMMIALPIYFQMVYGYNAMQTGLTLAPFSLSIFFVSLLIGRRGGQRRPSRIILLGFAVLAAGVAVLMAFFPRAETGLAYVLPMLITGTGIGLLVSQLNNYTLSPITEERVSEAAGVNSASGSFGLSFGLAFAGAMMLASLAFNFNSLAQQSVVLGPEQQAQVSAALEEDAQIMSDAQLAEQLAGQPADVQAEILRINDLARTRGLQVALLVPLVAGLLGALVGLGMVRRPDPEAVGDVEGMVLG